MTDYEPEPGFRKVLTRLDLGEADVIVTTPGDHVEWARQAGYKVTDKQVDGDTIYEIMSGDSGGTLPS